MASVVENERTKLLANALDRASTACVTVGLLAPTAAALYNLASPGAPAWLLVLGALVWLCAAVALHLMARTVLGRLSP